NFRLTVPLRQGEEIDRSPVQLEPEDIVLPGVPEDRNVLVLGPGPAARPAKAGPVRSETSPSPKTAVHVPPKEPS
ncbi:MAG TPA: two-component sensor histidine kinase, partial [Arthrobacter sp.]